MRHDVLSQQNAHPYAFRARQTNQEHQGGRIAAAAVDAKISLQNPFVVAEKEGRKKERRRARRYIAEEGKRPLRGRRCKRTVTFSDLIYAIDCGAAVMRSDGDSIERSKPVIWRVEKTRSKSKRDGRLLLLGSLIKS